MNFKKSYSLCITFCLSCIFVMTIVFWLQGQSSLHIAYATPNNKIDVTPSIKIQNIVNGRVPEDPFMPGQTTAREGKLVYSFMNKSEQESNTPTCYLVIRTLRVETSKVERTNTSTDVLTYILKGNYGTACDPLFSPDGNYILIKVGFAASRYDPFRLYILDVKTKSIKLLSQKQLIYRLVKWSPDSRYIAYFTGGDAEGAGDSRYSKPLELWVCDRVTGKEQFVEKNESLAFNITWGGEHTLYYGMLPKHTASPIINNSPKSSSKLVVPERPNIWAYSTEEAKSHLIVKDGYRPSIAYDNKSIAFYGSESSTKPAKLNYDWINRTGVSALTVMQINGKGRKPLSIMGGVSTFSVWKHDGHHLITISQKSETPKVKSEVVEWDIVTGKRRMAGELEANDYEESPRMSIYPSIRPVSISEDDKFLLSITQEYVGEEGQWLNQVDSVKAIDLSSGKVSIVARVMNSLGTDWRDEATPAVENSSTILR